MEVEEIIARTIVSYTGCGFTIEGEHVFCDDARLDAHPDHNGVSERCARCECRDAAPQVIAALDAAGFAIVPKEPTAEMITAGADAEWVYEDGSHVLGETPEPVWAAMLEAAK